MKEGRKRWSKRPRRARRGEGRRAAGRRRIIYKVGSGGAEGRQQRRRWLGRLLATSHGLLCLSRGGGGGGEGRCA